MQLVNARDVRNVPGRPKTDKLDAVWLAKLTEKGLLRRRSSRWASTPSVCQVVLPSGDPKHLEHVLKVVRKVEGVYDVNRVTSAV